MFRFILLTKRYYTNMDLISDRFGRLFHIPFQLNRNGCKGIILASDYYTKRNELTEIDGLKLYSVQLNTKSAFSYLWTIWNTTRSFYPDVIIASGDTFFGFVGFLLSVLLKIPFVFDIYDDYRAFGTNKLFFMKFLFTYLIKKADLVLCASYKLLNKLSHYNESIIVIENGVDEEQFRKFSRNDARRKTGIDDKDVVLGYFGAIASKRGVEILIEACRSLKETYPAMRLLLAGKNYLDLELKDSFIDYRGVVPQTDVPLLINTCNVAVIPYEHDMQVDVSNPCKLAEYLACKVPITATKISDIPEMLKEYPEALCSPGDVNDLMRAIRYQLKEQKIFPFLEELTWQSLGRRTFESINTLLGNKNNSKTNSPLKSD
jgi:glycosyltransferase involved in cell wall biosynthesis